MHRADKKGCGQPGGKGQGALRPFFETDMSDFVKT